jgi:hypothetical protein
MAANDRVGNLCVVKRLAGAIQPFLNQFHGTKHPLENIDALFADPICKIFGFHKADSTRTGRGNPIFFS